MLWRTHVLIALFFALCFIDYATNKFLFITIALFASLIPDIDSSNSYLGKNKIFLPLQLFTKHRGFFHSFILLLLILFISLFLIPFWDNDFFLGFILGFSSHLIADALTIQGIAFFNPFISKKIKGFIKTGGFFELILFLIFLILDLLLIWKIFF